jgi:hypothetical protein
MYRYLQQTPRDSASGNVLRSEEPIKTSQLSGSQIHVDFFVISPKMKVVKNNTEIHKI